MKKRPYRAIAVNDIDEQALANALESQDVTVGIDVAKEEPDNATLRTMTILTWGQADRALRSRAWTIPTAIPWSDCTPR